MLGLQGRLIVFEGVEGSGKSTQLERLQGWLTESGWARCLQSLLAPEVSPFVATREPGGTLLGQSLRQLLLDSASTAIEALPDMTELLLYAADRAQHVYTALKPALSQGTLVLCDRYTASTIAYQGYGRGLDLQVIDQLNALATGGLHSDLTLWLDIDVEAGLLRAKRRSRDEAMLQGADRMEAADLAFHRRVRQGFADLALASPQNMVCIEASGSEVEVAHRIQNVVAQHLQQWYPQLPLR